MRALTPGYLWARSSVPCFACGATAAFGDRPSEFCTGTRSSRPYEYRVGPRWLLVTLVVSIVVALVLLLLHTLLPKRLGIRGGRKLPGFWYPPRR